ncbi:MAG: hypothetical protein Q4G50_03815 [Corynebacterium sp.]|uniref:hypothetical protein n=1 Tax=Corynebacterium sp. TaxID=1720 RepID=UPI0026DF93F2|nr:hypothetical protein [Corynebacterium sp.]MDO5669109.1 hypothetical protein [Corynebacterium sp.]
MENKEARRVLERLENDAHVGAYEPSRAVAVLLAVIYGGVLLAAGWRQWWWMAGLFIALAAGLWFFRHRVMDTRTRDRAQETLRWHPSQFFSLWLPTIPLVARLAEGVVVVVALTVAVHLYWLLARGGWR